MSQQFVLVRVGKNIVPMRADLLDTDCSSREDAIPPAKDADKLSRIVFTPVKGVKQPVAKTVSYAAPEDGSPQARRSAIVNGNVDVRYTLGEGTAHEDRAKGKDIAGRTFDAWIPPVPSEDGERLDREAIEALRAAAARKNGQPA